MKICSRVTAISVAVLLLASCGGGGSDDVVANPLSSNVSATTANAVAGEFKRMKALGVAKTVADPIADQIFNWAEIHYPEYFPSHSANLVEGEWTYRAYMKTGVLLGTKGGRVFVAGGEFGATPIDLGPISNYVKPPIPVKRSSYENKMMAGEMFGRITIPKPYNPPDIWSTDPKNLEDANVGVALGDFFQDGSYSIVSFSQYYYGFLKPGEEHKAGKTYFYKWINGKWEDHTGKILKDQTGCVVPRKVLVADFNNDKKPDVLASCAGSEFGLPETWTGEYPRLLLSQSDGTYKNTKFPVRGYYHAMAAADVRGDGYADIVATDPMINRDVLYFSNNKDGTFTLDQSRLPQSSRQVSDGRGGYHAQSIWTVEWMPLYAANKFDLVLAGENGPNPYMTWSTRIYKPDSTNRYADANSVVLPDDMQFKAVYDMIAHNRSIYLYRVSEIATSNSMAVQRVNLSTLKSDRIYEHRGYFENGYSTGIWWLIYNNGMIRSYSDEAIVDVNP